MTVNTHPEGIPLDERVAMVDREDLAALWRSINDLTENERFLLRRWVEGVPNAQQLVFGAGQAGEVTLPGPGAQERFQGVAIFNYGTSPVTVGFSAGAALGLPLYQCPPQTLLVVPVNYQDLSVAGPTTGPTFAVTVCRLRVAPLSPQAYSLVGANAIDISDRAARQLGVVDVSDRAARQLGRTVEQGGIADSLRAAGVVTAPAPGAAIATIAAPGAGVYSVEITTFLDAGAPVVADMTNMRLQHGATAAGVLLSRASNPVTVVKERLTVAAAEAITVNAIAAGTAGVNYAAAIGATQIA